MVYVSEKKGEEEETGLTAKEITDETPLGNSISACSSTSAPSCGRRGRDSACTLARDVGGRDKERDIPVLRWDVREVEVERKGMDFGCSRCSVISATHGSEHSFRHRLIL
jgi:hypothetical protein